MNDDRPKFVTFADKKTEDTFEDLKEGKYESKKLYNLIERAISDLKKDPFCGIRIQKKLWPKDYIQKYDVTNLWKYNLPNAWRLIYTVKADEINIISIILEWFNHKDYEKRFNY
ncbi:type II toxin-antitoxin system YoeB family toxin [Candidatus Woesearchaeota archaeon]|nr:type II toxin-antitoxin system YoeB family toxin [Candidatus Woesearchaeota archaeon]